MKSRLLKSFLLLTTTICLSLGLSAQTDSAVWVNVTTSPTGYAPAIDSLPYVAGSGGLLSATTFRLNNLGIYSSGHPINTTAPFAYLTYSMREYAPNNVSASTAGAWPAATSGIPTVFVDFAVKATKANTYITGIKLPFLSKGGANANADLYYSTNGFTVDSTQIGVGASNQFKKDTFLVYPTTFAGGVLLKNVGDSFVLRMYPYYKGGSTGKGFSVEDVVIYANATTLPVKFGSVTASLLNNAVKVNWVSEIEVNTASYSIEKSTDGTNFVSIGNVAATGSKSYSFVDASPAAGLNLYKVVATDKDGATTSSSIVKVLQQTSTGLTVSPNPVVNKKVNIQLTGYAKGTYAVNIYSLSGQAVYATSISLDNSSYSQSITLPNSVKAGIYELVIGNGTSKTTKTIAVQ